jgi:glycosyltransferase involved in cell wall biosynthesis
MKDFEVVICDDGRQTSLPIVEEFYTKLKTTYIRGQPVSLSAARNACIKEAKGDYLAFIDDDAIAPVDWTGKITQNFTGKKIFALGGMAYPAIAANKIGQAASFLSSGEDAPKTDSQTAFCIRSCNMAFKKTALLRAGMFDEKLENTEGTDMALRLYRMGFSIFFDPQLSITRSQRSTLGGIARQFYRNGKSRVALLSKFGLEEKTKTDVAVMLAMAAFALSIPFSLFFFAPVIFLVPLLLVSRAFLSAIILLAKGKSNLFIQLFGACLVQDSSFLAGFFAGLPAAFSMWRAGIPGNP